MRKPPKLKPGKKSGPKTNTISISTNSAAAADLGLKVFQLISDFRRIYSLCNNIEHEMEKRIVARHGLVKLDALLQIVPRHKNNLRSAGCKVDHLEALINRLRKDYTGSEMETGRDALAAHALKLDLSRLVDTWKFMGETTFGVLESDLSEIDDELKKTDVNYTGAVRPHFNNDWKARWAERDVLGDPSKPRYATIYPGLGTAGIVAPVAGGHPAQDATIRGVGLATFIRQVRLLKLVPNQSSDDERLFAEMILNDYIALWELLFSPSVTNEHGAPDKSILKHWQDEGFQGADCLAKLQLKPHIKFAEWRKIRNTISAHVDAALPFTKMQFGQWPFYMSELIDECLRVIEAFRQCSSGEIRTRIFWIPPNELKSDKPNEKVIGLAAQEGRHWAD